MDLGLAGGSRSKGTSVVLSGSLVAATAMIKEKERGTVEQLLMTPASAIEVVAAKIAPLFVLLLAMTGLALTVARLVFHVPFRGSLVLEAMPKWIQPFTYLNPIAHFAGLARAVMVRAAELDVVYVQLFALGVIASVPIGFSAWKFRGQMS